MYKGRRDHQSQAIVNTHTKEYIHLRKKNSHPHWFSDAIVGWANSIADAIFQYPCQPPASCSSRHPTIYLLWREHWVALG